jgi:uncharacterized protein (DUF924 family)
VTALETPTASGDWTTSSRLATPDDVISFWFGPPIASEKDASERIQRWFRGGEAFDAEVRGRFLGTIEAALRGELDAWASRVTGRLALIVVLDQLTRNAFRGTPRAWSGDARALALALAAIDGGLDSELPFEQRTFLAMPLHHAEDLGVQNRHHARVLALRPLAPPQLRRLAEAGLEQATKYLDIIQRFGRFPFRNQVLGRASTPEEERFMQTFVAPPRV